MDIAAQFSSLASQPENTTPILLANITNPEKARELFQGRRTAGAEANTKFDKGDHYQEGRGYVGAKPLPGAPAYAQTMCQIKEGFVSENVIKEVADRHIPAVLGREPLWGFLPFDAPSPDAEKRRKVFGKLFNIVRAAVSRNAGGGTDKLAQEADDALTSAWWNTAKVRKSLKQAVRTALLEERVVIRFFFPQGLRDESGNIPVQKELANALKIPQIMVLTADRAGVFTDDDTQQEFGLHVYKVGDDVDAACLTYVDPASGLTVQRIMVDKQVDQTFTFDLGGRLLMYEIQRDALITEQIRTLQKSLNLTRTMMVRNINLAGSLERTVMNAERPKSIEKVFNADGTTSDRTVDGDYPVGAGAIMFLTGMLIRDDDGRVINRANPNISFRDPVSTKTFTETRDDLYAAILSGCHQRFALISGDATSSGKSRIEARSEFESSLKDSKDAIDDAGRWLLETQLRLAAIFCGRSKDFLQLRCDFNAIIETGPVSPEEREANRADVQAKLMSKETAMSRNGMDDTDAELQRIAQEPESVEPPPNQPPGDQPPGDRVPTIG